MSDSDEDYMSDKFVMQGTKTDVRPGLLFRQSDKRSFEIYKNGQKVLQKPKPKEQERLDAGLKTAISSENKGFKMLEKMGYTPGTGLGKSTIGIKEPISISIKTNSSGLGLDKHVKNITKQKMKLKEKHLQECENEFLAARTEKFFANYLKSDICKGQRLCEDLDMKHGIEYPESPQFWQKDTIKALKKKKKRKLTDEDVEDYSSSESDSDSDDDQDKEIPLREIIIYLRTTYKYCMYCGDYIEDETECPGYFRPDHD